jgi:hypothetical protein
MVDFDLSVAHFPNVAMHNNLVNEVLCLLSLARGKHGMCILVCTLVAASSHLLSLVVGLSITLLSQYTSHSVTAIPACLYSPNGSAGHTVFSSFCTGRPSRVTYMLIPLLLGYYELHTFLMKNTVCVSFETDVKPRSAVQERIAPTFRRR